MASDVQTEMTSAAQQLNAVELRSAEVLADVQRVMGTLTNSYRSMTGLTVEYMGVYSGAIEHVTEELTGTIDASKDFMRKCLELDVEMEAIDGIAAQARFLDADLDRLEAVVERLCADASPRRGAGALDIEPVLTHVSPTGSLRAETLT